VAAVGIVLLLPGVVVFGVRGWKAIRAVEWIRYEPYVYVLRQARSAVPQDRNLAIAELLRRVREGKVSDARLAALVDEQLDVQADIKQPWIATRGDIVETARQQKKLADEKWHQYLRNIEHFRLTARAKVRRGDELPYVVADRGPRLGSKSEVRCKPRLVIPPGQLAEVPKVPPAEWPWFITLQDFGGFSINYTSKLDPDRLSTAPDGEQTLKVQWHLDVWEPGAALDGTPTVTVDREMSTTWTLVPADAATMEAVKDDPDLHQRMKQRIRVRPLYFEEESGPDELYTYIDADSLPVPLAHNVYARSGKREWLLTTLCGTSGHSTSHHVDGFDVDVVDVVFRPDPKAAISTIDLTRYWDGELVIPDVKVRRPKGMTTRPATTRAAKP
jgi:hypothetical protein